MRGYLVIANAHAGSVEQEALDAAVGVLSAAGPTEVHLPSDPAALDAALAGSPPLPAEQRRREPGQPEQPGGRQERSVQELALQDAAQQGHPDQQPRRRAHAADPPPVACRLDCPVTMVGGCRHCHHLLDAG